MSDQQTNLNILSVGAIGVSVVALSSVIYIGSPWLMFGAATVGTLSAVAAEIMARTSTKKFRVETDQEAMDQTLNNMLRVQSLLNGLEAARCAIVPPEAWGGSSVAQTGLSVNGEVPANVTIPPPADPRCLNNEPHLFIYAGTGAGKSLFTEWLLRDVLEGFPLWLNPHHDENGMGPVVNLTSTEDALTMLNAYFTGELEERYGVVEPHIKDKQSIAYVLDALEQCMRDRFEVGWMQGWPMLNVLVDETALIANDKLTKASWKDAFIPSSREARKVNIRFIILSQSNRAKALGLANQYDVLENLYPVRINSFAQSFARKHGDEGLQIALKQSMAMHGRCWLIGDEENLHWLEPVNLLHLEPVANVLLSDFDKAVLLQLKEGEPMSASKLCKNHKSLKWTTQEVRGSFEKLAQASLGDWDGQRFIRTLKVKNTAENGDT